MLTSEYLHELKKRCETHFRRRCIQRLGVPLLQKKLREMMRSGDGSMQLLVKEKGASLWFIKGDGKIVKDDLVLVHNDLADRFVTVLFHAEWQMNRNPWEDDIECNHPEYIKVNHIRRAMTRALAKRMESNASTLKAKGESCERD